MSRFKHRKISLWLTAFAVFCVFRVSVSAEEYYFDKWDTDNGLPQNTIGAIQQTSDGYLWLATLDGLVRFDGVKFKVFTIANSEGIISNRFRLLHETPDGALWIGTEEFGVTRYKDGKFRSFTTADGLPNDNPLFLGTDADNNLLVETGNGVAKFNGERFEPIVTGNTDVGTCQAQGGGFWRLDNNGLRRLRNGAVDTVLLESSPLKYDYVALCYEDKTGGVWLLGNFGEIFIVKNKSLERLSTLNNLPADASVYFVAETDDSIWLGTDKGLLQFKNNRFELYDKRHGLSDNFVVSFYYDREGLIWLGTSLGGLNLLNRRAITVLTAADGLAGNSVYPIYEARDEAVWVGSNGVTRIENGVFQRFTQEKDKVPGDTTAIAEDKDGRLWLGTSGGVGFLQNGKYTELGDKFAFQRGSYTVWAIHQDRTGAIWFGTNKGLVRMSAGNLKVLTVENGLPSNDIKVIHEDSAGRLWFGTYGGLSVLENGKFQNFTAREGLSSERVRSLYQDAEGTIWLGTYDGGLNRFRNGKFTNYSTRNGLFSDGVFQILPDDEGFFWMSGNQGIYRVRKQELEDLAAGKIQSVSSEVFGKRDGLLNTECNGGRQPAGIRAKNGLLWFPTQHGAAIVNPKTIRKNPLAPPVLIESISLDRKNIDLNANILISPQQTNFEIAYTALSFVKPEQIRFRYKLEGLDGDWVEAGTRRTAYYSHLPPGEYTFLVKAANNSGVWNETGAQLIITVQPPFWRKWWFALLTTAGLAGLIYFVINRRIKTLERERAVQTAFAQKLIAAQERERKRIAGELHDGLGQNLLVIKNWILLARQRAENGNAEILEEISDTASQTIDEVRRIAYNLRPYQIEEIGLTRALEGMLKRLAETTDIRLSWRIDNVDKTFTAENEINLFRIVQECANNIVRHSGANEAKFTVEKYENFASLRIEDNGKGFAPENLNGNRGLGLTGIEERARMMNGAASIKSEPEKGTIVQIKINL